MIEDNTEHNEPMEDDALTEEDEALALNELESEDHTEDEQILTHHVILEQGDKTPSPIATRLSSFSSSSSSSSSIANLTWRDISGGTQGVATASTRVQVDTALTPGEQSVLGTTLRSHSTGQRTGRLAMGIHARMLLQGPKARIPHERCLS